MLMNMCPSTQHRHRLMQMDAGNNYPQQLKKQMKDTHGVRAECGQGRQREQKKRKKTTQIFSCITSLPNVYIRHLQSKLKHQQLSVLSSKSNHDWVGLLLPYQHKYDCYHISAFGTFSHLILKTSASKWDKCYLQIQSAIYKNFNLQIRKLRT